MQLKYKVLEGISDCHLSVVSSSTFSVGGVLGWVGLSELLSTVFQFDVLDLDLGIF